MNRIEDAAVILGENVLKGLTECDRYNIIVSFIASDNEWDRERFLNYFNHLKKCPPCRASYNYNLEMDVLLRGTMLQPVPPSNLRSKIIQTLSRLNPG